MLAKDPNNPPSVPQGWLAKYDDEYKAFFYVDLKTNKSQWDAPPGTSFERSANDVLPPPYSPYESNSVQPQNQAQTTQIHRQQAPPQQQVPPQGHGQYPQQYVQQLQHNPRMSGLGMGGLGMGGGLLGGLVIGNMMRARQRTSCPPRRRRRYNR